MMENQGRETGFGCPTCWPADASAAWEARGGLSQIAELIDESHFHVMILGCRRCGQRFVSVFTESIDWADGDDPQHWLLFPLAPPEADDLLARRGSLSEGDLSGLDRARRCLQRDYPKGAPSPRLSWTIGLVVGPHD